MSDKRSAAELSKHCAKKARQSISLETKMEVILCVLFTYVEPNPIPHIIFGFILRRFDLRQLL